MAFRLLTKGTAAAAVRPAAVLAASRQPATIAALRKYSSEAPAQQKSSILDQLPGDSLAAKVGYLTAGTGVATALVAKEIYIFNEESLVLIASVGLLGVLLKYLREPYSNMANEHINRIKSVLNQARADHTTAVQERINEVGQMKDLVEVTQNLFALSRETAQIEAEAFELKQQVAVAAEVKSTLDSWVRHETNLREREQKQLAAYLIEKINKDLQDPAIQKQILDQAVADVENLAKTA
ncbi:hypothetical protein BCR43DRAFT_86864 [Syncephalastrum racemosum]|uniref:ATP synthase subunit 4 n=1 Tax=Syncephalastrum racemosum TaxID=13706 RepID=A0A1X2H3A1_SYNRA|nr:hypothetical protein BCR43DRAFT_86864 [Syncephalastrum racemosum]